MVESRAHAIRAVCIAMPIITGIFIALRFYTRAFMTRQIKLNDYVAFATMIPIICYSVLLAQATYTGMGQHEQDFTPEQEQGYYFWILVASEFYVLSLAGFKASLLLLYIHVFGSNKKFRWACYIVMFYTMGFLFSNLITESAGCHPIQHFWDPNVKGTCINFVAADIAYGFGIMSSDLMIAILPLPMIWRLQVVEKREKVGLALVLTSGGIVFIISAARWIVSTIDLVSEDRTWIAGAGFLLSVVEVNTGLICSCTPALKPFFATARRASSQYIRRGSRKRSFDTEKIIITPDSAIRKSSEVPSEKPLPELPGMAVLAPGQMTRPELGSGRNSRNELDAVTRVEMGSPMSKYELMANEEALKHEAELEDLGMLDHDAYAGQNEIGRKPSPRDASEFV